MPDGDRGQHGGPCSFHLRRAGGAPRGSMGCSRWAGSSPSGLRVVGRLPPERDPPGCATATACRRERPGSGRRLCVLPRSRRRQPLPSVVPGTPGRWALATADSSEPVTLVAQIRNAVRHPLDGPEGAVRVACPELGAGRSAGLVRGVGRQPLSRWRTLARSTLAVGRHDDVQRSIAVEICAMVGGIGRELRHCRRESVVAPRSRGSAPGAGRAIGDGCRLAGFGLHAQDEHRARSPAVSRIVGCRDPAHDPGLPDRSSLAENPHLLTDRWSAEWSARERHLVLAKRIGDGQALVQARTASPDRTRGWHGRRRVSVRGPGGGRGRRRRRAGA